MTWGADRLALRDHYKAKAPVAESRLNLFALGGRPFRPPALPVTTGMTDAERLAALAAVVHVRLEIVAGRSARALHLGATATTETQLDINQRIFYPAAHGEAFLTDALTPIVDAAMGAFHPSHAPAGGIRFEDTEEPDSLGPDPESPGWASIEIVTHCYAHRIVAAA